MNDTQDAIESNNPFVLTSIDGRAIILRKDDARYYSKRNDRILSIDCVLANSDRLAEIEDGVFELDPQPVT